MSENFMVVDFCSSKIVLFLAELGPELKIKNWTPIPVDQDTIRSGQIYNLENVASKIRKGIEETTGKSRYEPADVYIGFSDPEVEFLSSIGMAACGTPDNPSEITEKHLDQAITSSRAVKLEEGRVIVQTIPVRFDVDSKTDIKNPKGMLGVRLEVKSALITAKKSSLLNFKRALEKAGIYAERFAYQPVAEIFELPSEEEKENGILIIDIGRDLTNYGVITENKLQLAETLPVGGIHINKDLKHYFNITIDKAEEIKKKYGQLTFSETEDSEYIDLNMGSMKTNKIKRDLLVKYISERLSEIFEFIKERLIQNDLKDKITFIKITGGTSQIEGIEKLAEKIFNITAEVYTPSREIEKLTGNYDIPVLNSLCSSLAILLFAHRNLTSGVSYSADLSVMKNVKGIFKKMFGK
jgi:cell division protein FtsA